MKHLSIRSKDIIKVTALPKTEIDLSSIVYLEKKKSIFGHTIHEEGWYYVITGSMGRYKCDVAKKYPDYIFEGNSVYIKPRVVICTNNDDGGNRVIVYFDSDEAAHEKYKQILQDINSKPWTELSK